MELIIKMMEDLFLDILCLQETKVAHSSAECKAMEWAKDIYFFYFSSSAKPKTNKCPKADPISKAKANAKPAPNPKT